MSIAPLLERLLSATAPEESNPAFGAKEMKPEDYLRHLNDNIPDEQTPYASVEDAIADGHNIPTQSKWFSPSGQDVTKYATDSSYGNNPMKTPGFWQRFANPQGADREIAYNTEYATKPGFAQQGEDINKGIIESRLGDIPSEFNPTGMTKNQLYSTGYTGKQTPDELTRQGIASLNAHRGGIPLTSSANMLEKYGDLANADFNLGQLPSVQNTIANKNKTANIASTGELGREETTQNILNKEQLNTLQRVTGVDPIQIQLAHDELTAQLKREPMQEELREYIIANQKAMEEQRAKDIPFYQRTEHNNTMGALRQSLNQPTAQSPFATGPDGTVHIDPTYVSKIAQSKAMLGDYSGLNLNPRDNTIHSIGNGLHVALPTTPATSDKGTNAPAVSKVAIPSKTSLRNIKEPTEEDQDFIPIQDRLINLLRKSGAFSIGK